MHAHRCSAELLCSSSSCFSILQASKGSVQTNHISVVSAADAMVLKVSMLSNPEPSGASSAAAFVMLAIGMMGTF